MEGCRISGLRSYWSTLSLTLLSIMHPVNYESVKAVVLKLEKWDCKLSV